MKLPSSVLAAVGIVAVTALYFGARMTVRLFSSDEKAPMSSEKLKVIAINSLPQQKEGVIVLRGRTEAELKAIVRADASGVIIETPTALGARVKKGDILCRLDVEARGASTLEAEAAFKKADLDYQAGLKLAAEGFRSEAGIAGLKAARDQARANRDRATIELEKTFVRAPLDGVFEARAAKIGDLVKPGDACGTVVKPSPFLVTGSIAEKDVALIHAGDLAHATLATGEKVEGFVRFVAASSDPATRTFSVEIEVPNPDGKLRDGVTADIVILGQAKEAYKIPRSALTLDDEGRIGIKAIGDDSLAVFYIVSIIGEEQDGVWIVGPLGPLHVIVRGQEYVKSGEPVAAEIRGSAS
ncbi:MAG: efflux RND transporter periplasmic adaptor subunit [Parvularculaceae bacterium]|nr:efflux RND transporter periplasmic adaptor subunit [Parvularculaceae bacterium]